MIEPKKPEGSSEGGKALPVNARSHTPQADHQQVNYSFHNLDDFLPGKSMIIRYYENGIIRSFYGKNFRCISRNRFGVSPVLFLKTLLKYELSSKFSL